MNRGWWKLEIDVRMNGIKVDFDELSRECQRKVMKMIANGCVAGEICESDDWAPAECEEEEDERIPLF